MNYEQPTAPLPSMAFEHLMMPGHYSALEVTSTAKYMEAKLVVLGSPGYIRRSERAVPEPVAPKKRKKSKSRRSKDKDKNNHDPNKHDPDKHATVEGTAAKRAPKNGSK